MAESIEEFLARGGQIQRIPRGVSGLDSTKPMSRHIVLTKGDDPRQARREGNKNIFNKKRRKDV